MQVKILKEAGYEEALMGESNKVVKDYNCIDWNELFEYDNSSATGLRWKIDILAGKHKTILAAKAGSVAGFISTEKRGTKYAIVKYKSKKYRVHRVIYIMHNGSIDNNLVIDHIDRNTLNNSICNLRAVTNKTNCRNRNKRVDNSSGVNGVGFQVNGKYVSVSSELCEYVDGELKTTHKYFSVNKYGLIPAFAMVCKYRDEQLARLNSFGYSYTETHGRDSCK